MSPQRAVKIIEQVASALHAAHRIGLLHRDVKPSNILVAEDDFAYLIDFGIARAAGETGLTSTGATIGTWAYMAPERFEHGTADSRADIYALTCVLYQSLCAQPPFPARSLEQIAMAHLVKPPPKPSENRPSVPKMMDSVIATGMAKNPDERYPTTKKLATAARTALTPQFAPRADAAGPRPLSLGQEALGDLRAASTKSEQGARQSSLKSVTDEASAHAFPVDSINHGSQGTTRPAPSVFREHASDSVVGARIDLAHSSASDKVPVRRSVRTSRLLVLCGVIALTLVAAIVIVNTTRSSSPGGDSATSRSPTSSNRETIAPQTTMTAPPDPLFGLSSYAPRDVGCQPGFIQNAQVRQTIRIEGTPIVSCDAGGQLKYLLFERFSTKEALRSAFDAHAKGESGGWSACPESPEWKQPGTPGSTTGSLSCRGGVRYDGIAYSTIYWTYDDALVMGMAQGVGDESVGDVYRWWNAHYQ